MEPLGDKRRVVSATLIVFLAIGVVLLVGYTGFGWENNFNDGKIGRFFNFSNTPQPEPPRAWQVFEQYLGYLDTHDLEGMKSLSHQVSPACSDPARIEECFALMDNVYGIGHTFAQSDFKYIQEDQRQILLHTDGPVVAILFFTKVDGENIKILGMRFCVEDDAIVDTCVETERAKRDKDNDGWWDSVESLFYN